MRKEEKSIAYIENLPDVINQIFEGLYVITGSSFFFLTHYRFYTTI